MALYLELDQCSNSRTHQDFAPTKTHMVVHILSNGIKQQRMEEHKIETEQKKERMLLHRTEIAKQSWKHKSNRYK